MTVTQRTLAIEPLIFETYTISSGECLLRSQGDTASNGTKDGPRMFGGNRNQRGFCIRSRLKPVSVSSDGVAQPGKPTPISVHQIAPISHRPTAYLGFVCYQGV